MAKRKTRKFNWQGIDENSDGTFTTKGKREKRRVIKALHEQGVAVRSRQNPDGSYTVTPVGSVKVKAAPRTASVRASPSTGHRLNTKESGFPMYPKRGRSPARSGAYPVSSGGPSYRGGPRVAGPGMGGRQLIKGAGDWLNKKAREHGEKIKEAQRQKQETKKLSEEMSEKWKKEQKQYDADYIGSQPDPIRQAELKESIKRAEAKAEQRRSDETIARQQQQRQQRSDIRHFQSGATGTYPRAPEIPKQKVDPATLQHAREQAITGNP